MAKHSYTRNGQPISEADALDDHGVLRDGCTAHVAARFRDARMSDRYQVYDAFGHPAGYRPGFVFNNDQAARDAKAAAYRDYDRDIGRAWQNVENGAGENGQPGDDVWNVCQTCSGRDLDCPDCDGYGRAYDNLPQRMHDHRRLMDKLTADRDAEVSNAWRGK